ncbi:MAG: hypothetical protein KJ646_01485 [Nanoarchaeota archaeon]|nr:hypothetical protein [Nanoarchaeota archaeon]MBU4116207.1 hypothetical protein [Nanoarchaeota archaeon]
MIKNFLKREPFLEYFQIIDRCAKNEEKLVINNSSPSNTVYLLQTFFLNAKSNVDIFTKNFPNFFQSEDLADTAEGFLSRNLFPNTLNEHKIRLAYQSDLPEKRVLSENKFLERLVFNPRYKSQIEIYNANKLEMSGADVLNFQIADSKFFRYDFCHPLGALADFGDKKNARKLQDCFNRIVSSSKKLDVGSYCAN